jgi:hypothetical protein
LANLNEDEEMDVERNIARGHEKRKVWKRELSIAMNFMIQ